MGSDEGQSAVRGLTKARVEALTDGIFAVAMTLLILDVKVPVVTDESVGTELPRRLLAYYFFSQNSPGRDRKDSTAIPSPPTNNFRRGSWLVTG